MYLYFRRNSKQRWNCTPNPFLSDFQFIRISHYTISNFCSWSTSLNFWDQRTFYRHYLPHCVVSYHEDITSLLLALHCVYRIILVRNLISYCVNLWCGNTFLLFGIRFGRMDGRTDVNLKDFSVTLAQQFLVHWKRSGTFHRMEEIADSMCWSNCALNSKMWIEVALVSVMK